MHIRNVRQSALTHLCRYHHGDVLGSSSSSRWSRWATAEEVQWAGI